MGTKFLLKQNSNQARIILLDLFNHSEDFTNSLSHYLSERYQPYKRYRVESMTYSHTGFKMATEDHYRKQAAFYRNSAEYNRMITLYSVLKSSIEDTRGEQLVT